MRVTNESSATNNCSNSSQHPSLFFHMNYIYVYFVHTWAAISWSTSRIRASWPRLQVRLNLWPALFYIGSSCICLGPPNSLLFGPKFHIPHVYPPLKTRRLSTTIQVNNMGRLHLMYNGRTYIHHIISTFLILSSYFFYTLGQVDWPRPLMLRTIIVLDGVGFSS
jgi:hypothetical protein